jgi:hypothetical protein
MIKLFKDFRMSVIIKNSLSYDELLIYLIESA